MNLYLVGTPIGNYEDISLRALRILKESDIIVCEEMKEARRLLARLGISKDLVELNEHNEQSEAPEVIKLMLQGKSCALISDCGMPLFSDPGHMLVDLAISKGIKISPVPGANSLLLALVGSGMNIEKFYHYGWLSPKSEIRKRELSRLKGRRELISFMDTPYRLQRLVSDCLAVFGNNVSAVLAYELTKEKEEFFRGSLGEIHQAVLGRNLKGEYVLLLDLR